ncbi:MAG: flavin reductase family protein [Syntrophaceae bacterium]
MAQVKIDTNVFIPMPVSLVGCMLGGKANFMAAGWVTRVNAKPPWIGIGIGRVHATAEGILENRSFSVCFPNRAKLIETDYCGIVSGKKVDKSAVFTPFWGDLKTAPMIQEASLNLECALVQTVEGPTNLFFIGEIKAAYAPEGCLEHGHVNPRKADFMALTMPDNTYWSLGENLGQAWHIGTQFRGGGAR